MDVIVGNFECIELSAEGFDERTWTTEEDVDSCEVEVCESDGSSKESAFFVVPDNDSEIRFFLGEAFEVSRDGVFAFIANGVEECCFVVGGEAVGEGEEWSNANAAGNPALIF